MPGFTLVALYLVYQAAIAWLRPAVAPAMAHDNGGRVSLASLGSALVPPIVLIVAVLGSILGGVATPTEAASVGAVGATMLAAIRIAPRRSGLVLAAGAALVAMMIVSSQFDLRLGRAATPLDDRMAIWASLALAVVVAAGIAAALWRTYRAGVLTGVATSTLKISAMIFATLIGASMFALVFRGLGGDELVGGILAAMPGGELGAIAFVMVLVFLLGFVLDFVEISIIVVPIVGPVLLAMGIDPIWLAVMLAINLQTSFLTPPFGFSLFYLRGAAPREVRTLSIYRGVAPYIVINLSTIALVYTVPQLATWLPTVLFG